MSVSMSGLELSGGEGVPGGSCRGDMDGTGVCGGQRGSHCRVQKLEASREGQAWGKPKSPMLGQFLLEDGEIPGPAEMEAGGSTGGF